VSIDQGVLDSTSTKNRSSLAILVKKRIVDGQYFKQTSNLYVAKYMGRSLDVRWDYEEALKLAMYYDAEVNIEYTKIGIVQYFRECKQYHRLMKRPMVAISSAGDGQQAQFGVKASNLIGTTATTQVIDHQDGKVKEYIDDSYQDIFFLDLLEQLRDYQREDRTKFDLVIAMGLCELADEDMMGVPPREAGEETAGFKLFGWYADENGFMHFGELPDGQRTIFDETAPKQDSPVRWVDSSGKARFDDKFDVLYTDE